MALVSRRPRRLGIDIWPGFVDALSQLVMVIIFVLLIFTAGQFYLNDELRTRDAALQRLTRQIQGLTDMLSLEKQTSGDLRSNLSVLSAQLQAANRERDALTTRVAELAARADEATARSNRNAATAADAQQSALTDKDKIEVQLREIESLQRDIAALKAVRAQLETQVADLAAAREKSDQAVAAAQQDLAAARQEATQAKRQLTTSQLDLATANQELTALRDRSKSLEARLSTAEERTALAQKAIDERDVRLQAAQGSLDQLNQDVIKLREQLQKIGALLADSEAKSKDQQVKIADLGQRLNQALASRVAELARYRSEFFGRLRQVIGDRSDIRIVGDRFVFQSEVLFTPGKADLSDEARAQLAPVAAALKDLVKEIPTDIAWVLRVDGHTDRRPINTAQFPSNWELSTARAISVVRYLFDQGIPADRLAAAGFGENQPVDPRDTDDAYRRNRRIELKLTDR